MQTVAKDSIPSGFPLQIATVCGLVVYFLFFFCLESQLFLYRALKCDASSEKRRPTSPNPRPSLTLELVSAPTHCFGIFFRPQKGLVGKLFRSRSPIPVRYETGERSDLNRTASGPLRHVVRSTLLPSGASKIGDSNLPLSRWRVRDPSIHLQLPPKNPMLCTPKTKKNSRMQSSVAQTFSSIKTSVPLVSTLFFLPSGLSTILSSSLLC